MSVRIFIGGRISPFVSVVGFVKFSEYLVVADAGYRLLISSTFLPSVRPDTHVRYFSLVLLLINNYFDRHILSSNRVPNASSYT